MKQAFSADIILSMSIMALKSASSITASSASAVSSSSLLTCARSFSSLSLPYILSQEISAASYEGGGGMSLNSSRGRGGGRGGGVPVVGVRAFSSQLLNSNSNSKISKSSNNSNSSYDSCSSSKSNDNSIVFVNNRRNINGSYNRHSRNIISNFGGSCDQRLHLATWKADFSSKSKGKGRWHDNSNSNNTNNTSSNSSSSNTSNSSNSSSSNNSSGSSLPSHLGTDPSFVPGPIYTEDAEHLYKTEMKQLRKWLNPHIYQNNGRLFDADRGLLDDRYSKIFPAIKAELLETSKESIFPDCFPECDVKLVGISFKGYGQEACKTWMAPFLSAYGGNSRVRVGELFLSEHSILSPLTFMFVNAAKKNIPQERWSTTAVKIGNINEVAVPLLLPNKYSGYMFLLDKKNMIRWRSSGYPTGDEIETFLKLTKILLDKPVK